MTRVIKSREERVNEIIDASLILFQKKGYDETSIQDIADYLNISTGLCYRYFKSKQEIFIEASNRYAETFIQKIQEPFPKNITACEKFNLAVKRMITFGSMHEEFETTFQSEPEISYTRLNGVIEIFIKLMIPIVNEGMEQGVFKCNNAELTVKFIAYGFSNTIHSTMPKEDAKEHIAKNLNDLALICKNILQVTDDCTIGEGW